MKTETDTDLVKQEVSKITAHRLFNKSPRYIDLITFLAQQALAGNRLKEDLIGVEVFESDYTSVKNDGLVRVYMYNLRKKLTTYYSTDGKDAPIQFVLEKGSYDMKFITHESVTEPTPTRSDKQPLFSPSITKKHIGIGLLLLVLLSASAHYFAARTELYFWKPFFQTQTSNICILADQVVLANIGSKDNNHFIINDSVNSSDDFITHIERHHIDTLVKQDYTFFTKAIPHSIYQLSQLFFHHNSEFAYVPESQFRYDETAQNNIIYIGQHKTMSVSKGLFLRHSKIFKTHGHLFASYKNGKEMIYRPQWVDRSLRSEYAMVSFMPLQNGKKAIYFVSNNDIGTMAVVNNFTNIQFLNQFYEQLPSPDAYFNALFQVSGVQRTDVSCELVELEVVLH